MSTFLSPSATIHWLAGTNLDPVWSQLMTNSDGVSFSFAIEALFEEKEFFHWQVIRKPPFSFIGSSLQNRISHFFLIQ